MFAVFANEKGFVTDDNNFSLDKNKAKLFTTKIEASSWCYYNQKSEKLSIVKFNDD